MAKVKKNIKEALKKVDAEIKGTASRGAIAGALASEGYSGGYRDCLHDMRLVLAGIQPNRRNYWDDWEE